ncbi:TonB-dependent receptor domain-containing protein [Coralloluteibacterium thermophilus]|uniref:TonB-dependent receptor domain-containing protein n=1 Tax=Coralloluteibacterium thermophilum TaxID=2707049 RepID=A0ABV9NMP5_9GAMM
MSLPLRGTRAATAPRLSLLALALAAAPALAEPNPAAAPRTLDQVVVTASGFEQMIREAPASISVITREDLENKPFHGIAEALADVEGIDIGDAVDKTGAPSISIRGMPAQYTLILIDGRRQNVSGNVAPNGFDGTQNNFIPPLSAIERIEIIRGPMSTLYGSDAMGGVVNIITRKVGDAWRGNVMLETTLQDDSRFGDSRGGNFYLNGPLARDVLGLAVYGSVHERDATAIAYGDLDGEEIVPWMGANPVAYDNFSLGARLSLTPSPDHDLWLEANRNRQTYDNSDGQMGTLGAGGYAETQRYNRDQAILAWDARFGFGTLESSLARSTTETIGRLIPPGVAGAGGPRRLENENLVFDTKLVTSFGAHMLSVGGQWWKAELVDGVVSDPFDFRQWALFVEDEWSLADDLKLTLGARRDDHSVFGGQTSPRAYLVWNASPNWVLKGGVSRGYKTPRVEQLTPGINGFGQQGRLPLLGTPTLQPEITTTTEIGAYYAGDTGINASLSLFNNEFKDKIATGVPVANCTFGLSRAEYEAGGYPTAGCVDVGYWPNAATFGQSVNIDEAVTRGAEASLRLPLSPAWALVTNYTFTDSEQKSGAAAGQPLLNTPRHMLNSALQWQVTDAVDLYLRGQYRSARYRGEGPAQDQLGDYKPYTVWHLGGTWRASENVSVNAAIYNLFDKDFVRYLPYVSDAAGTVAYANTHINNEDGRRLWVSLNVGF